MATVLLKFGPADHGRRLTLDAFDAAEFEPEYKYEIIDGRLYVDLERNVEMYLAVPSIKEYWVIDDRDNPEVPTLIQHHRTGKRWLVQSSSSGSTFTTVLLPGFSLLIDPRK